MTNLSHFEQQMRRDLARFTEARERPAIAAATPRRRGAENPGARSRLVVTLVVRAGRLSPDTLFVHESRSLSRLEAQIDAERAARAAGWPIIGRVHAIEAKEG